MNELCTIFIINLSHVKFVMLEWLVSCEDHPKSNWMVGCSGLSTHFLVMNIHQMYVHLVLINLNIFRFSKFIYITSTLGFHHLIHINNSFYPRNFNFVFNHEIKTMGTTWSLCYMKKFNSHKFIHSLEVGCIVYNILP